jgi:rhodanese-related sulfurtransferase
MTGSPAFFVQVASAISERFECCYWRFFHSGEIGSEDINGKRILSSRRKLPEGNGLIMKSAWSKGILPLILWFATGLLFSAFSPAVHADSGSLYISTESVLSMLNKRQEILFVDVRDRGAFDRFRIPGSIHIPLYALKTKPFLKDKLLVLVSEGYPNFALEQTCEGVKVAGFTKTSILSGGLRSWIQKKGPIEGDAFARNELSRVPPKHFYAHKDSPEWLVITVSRSAAGSSQPMIPGALHLPWEEGNPSKFASALKAIINSKARSPLLSVLVCDERGEKYESIDRAVQQEEIRKVFYLKGGMEAYQAFLQQQALLGQPGKEEVKRCVNCP